VNPPIASLDARIDHIRWRRRRGWLKQLAAVIGPLLIGMSILILLAALGVITTPR
jgi:hypothetical protein